MGLGVMAAMSGRFSEHCIAWAMTNARCTRIEAIQFAEWAEEQAAARRITTRTEFPKIWAGWGEWCRDLNSMLKER